MAEDELDYVAQLNANLRQSFEQIRTVSEEVISARDIDGLIDVLRRSLAQMEVLMTMLTEIAAERAVQRGGNEPQ
jgi:hypothetical protein